MQKQERINLAIRSVVTDLMDRVMNKVTLVDPFIKEDHRLNRPLYAALVPDEIFKGSHFERRFVTPFGGVWEKLAVVVAREFHGHCEMGHRITGTVGKESLRRIQETLARLEHPEKGAVRTKPDWVAEMKYIRAGGGQPIPVDVVCDIYIESQETGLRYAFEVRSQFPDNLQTKASKEKMLKLMAMSHTTVDQVFFALPCNASGKDENSANAPIAKWFGKQKDARVLLASQFWDMIGGDGTYANLIREVKLHGKEYHHLIYADYLGITILAG